MNITNVLYGTNTVSLLHVLKKVIPSVQNIEDKYIYFIQRFSNNPLSEKSRSRLADLLDSEVTFTTLFTTHNSSIKDIVNSKGKPPSEADFIIMPRFHTISPWSSKAMDIIRNGELHDVQRVERGTAWYITTHSGTRLSLKERESVKHYFYDPMTESVIEGWEKREQAIFPNFGESPAKYIEILENGGKALETANRSLGLALSDEEINYLVENFEQLERNPSDAELMMFAQVNSEHCRHKIFNAEWTVDGQVQAKSLFSMIKQTYCKNPVRVLSAYSDNAAVCRGNIASYFYPDPNDHIYQSCTEEISLLVKVETHNHPTAISPYPGAATGSGGEIRDEAATGRGARPKAGLVGFSVSDLHIPDLHLPWEIDQGKPKQIASALDIMLQGPIGAASFNNEFGRPAVCGYFRTYTQQDGDVIRGYHKPIMLAGGYGAVRYEHVQKDAIPKGAKIVVLGGRAMLIGLGGGAASSMSSGENDDALDFASVQRSNPQMQRLCQEVINACCNLGDKNPIISIHDVGAGGLSNALPELVHNSDKGADLRLKIGLIDQLDMSPMQIWCNESQERYVLAIKPESFAIFKQLCKRENAPYVDIGEATNEKRLVVRDRIDRSNKVVDLPLSLIFPALTCKKEIPTIDEPQREKFNTTNINISDAIDRVLHLPVVADKHFLITIADRSVSGLIVREQMVGPWQTPVADCAVTASAYNAYVGEAMAVGERAPIALINAPASARMAVGEAITNIAAARILRIDDIVLSANWMANCGEALEDFRLFNTVRAVSEFCQQLGICIPVGKDSLSMNAKWQENDQPKQVISPLSVVITAVGVVSDIRQSLTPQLNTDIKDSCLLLIDLGLGKNRLGGSALTQVYGKIAGDAPDVEDSQHLQNFFQSIQLLNEMGFLLAYHDRSDGGLLVTLCEMAFASRAGININLDHAENIIETLFTEELGAVIQIRKEHIDTVRQVFSNFKIPSPHIYNIATLNHEKVFRIEKNNQVIFEDHILSLHRKWSEITFYMQKLRDNPECAEQQNRRLMDSNDPGLSFYTTFDATENTNASLLKNPIKPKIAILREQGTNGHIEMAAAFQRAGFECVDVHINDIINDDVKLKDFSSVVACGGFSYGDVLGAGRGWAKSILLNTQLRDEFEAFFSRDDIFALGVCNGCQMFSELRSIIPGTNHWPSFEENTSGQFESRLVMVEILTSCSVLLDGMEGSKIPIVVAHGEGRVRYKNEDMQGEELVTLRYIDNYGKPSDIYPFNPNGSIGGKTGFTNEDGRVTIMMPHPERVFLRKQYSWVPEDWKNENSPWMRLFENARKYLH